MPLYDILNEFQKGSSHMAAVVKVKGKSKKSQSISLGEKFGGNGVFSGNSQLTTPLLTNDVTSENVVVGIDRTSRPNTNNQSLPPQLGAAAENLPYLLEDIEEGVVIGIITLEDVFEELLQVSLLPPLRCRSVYFDQLLLSCSSIKTMPADFFYFFLKLLISDLVISSPYRRK